MNAGNLYKNLYNIISGEESWIYSYEHANKNLSRLCVFQDEAKPIKIIRSLSVSNNMVATFDSKAGNVVTVPLRDQRTVNTDWYTTICLSEVIAELRKSTIKLHQGNVSSYRA